jgi:hypothetical protein
MRHQSYQGWAVVGGQRLYFQSMLECRFAKLLELLKGFPELSESILGHRVARWGYETRRFDFRRDSPDIENPKLKGKSFGAVCYTPDFQVWTPEGAVIFYECKGYMDKKSFTKLRAFNLYCPSQKLVLVTVRDFPDDSLAKDLPFPVLVVGGIFKQLIR